MSRWRLMRLRGQPSQQRGNGASGASQASEPHAAQIRAEQIRVLFEQLPSALISTAIVGTLVVYVLWDHVSRPWLTAWLVSLTLATLARAWLYQAYFKASPSTQHAPRWGRRFVAGVAISGV